MLFFRVKCINICAHDEGNPYWVAEQHLLIKVPKKLPVTHT